MNPNAMLDELIEGGLLAERDGGAELHLTDHITRDLEDERRRLEEADLNTVRRELDDGADIVDCLLDGANPPDGMLPHYLAARNHLDQAEPEIWLRLATVLFQLDEGMPPIDGVPAPFLPVTGRTLEVFQTVYPASIIYIWRHDCGPCEEIRRHFETIFSETNPDGFALFGIYGPDWAEILHERYEVVGGPTTLFTINDSVDLRIQGGCSQQYLEEEVETFRALCRQGSDESQVDAN
jgi:hypothetical protein